MREKKECKFRTTERNAPGRVGLRERSYVSQHARQSRRRRARRRRLAGPLLSMPPSKCTATRKWNHNLTTRATCWRSDVKWPRRTLDALLRKRYALICPYETLNRLDIDREDIMSSTFRARFTYPPPEVALSPLIVHIGPERARPGGRGRGRIERTTGKICRYRESRHGVIYNSALSFTDPLSSFLARPRRHSHLIPIIFRRLSRLPFLGGA